MGRFIQWFFKGRIEKAAIKKERIEILSEEYNKGQVCKISKPLALKISKPLDL